MALFDAPVRSPLRHSGLPDEEVVYRPAETLHSLLRNITGVVSSRFRRTSPPLVQGHANDASDEVEAVRMLTQVKRRLEME